MASLTKPEEELSLEDSDNIAADSARKRPLIIFAAIIAAIGVGLLLSTRAAAPENLSFEPESTTNVSGCLTPITNDPTASGGQAIKFSCTSPTGFKHPGVFLSQEQLDFVEQKIKDGAQPWTGEYNSMAASTSYANLSYQPSPVPTVECNWEPVADIGCSQHTKDALVAYTMALIYSYKGDVRYAQKAAQILNAWSSTVTKIAYIEGQAHQDGKLTALWATQINTRTAEILRYTYTGTTPTFNVAKYETMLRNVYLPLLTHEHFANWVASAAEAKIGVGVFLNDRTIYNEALAEYRARIAKIIFLESDPGDIPQPLRPSRTTPEQINQDWYYPTAYKDAMHQESCRDIGHSMMTLGSFANANETTRIQGDNLYEELENRLLPAFELAGSHFDEFLTNTNNVLKIKPTPDTWMPTKNWNCPKWQFNGQVSGGDQAGMGWEVAYNHYKRRKGKAMPNVERVLARPRTVKVGNMNAWERLTNTSTP